MTSLLVDSNLQVVYAVGVTLDRSGCDSGPRPGVGDDLGTLILGASHLAVEADAAIVHHRSVPGGGVPGVIRERQRWSAKTAPGAEALPGGCAIRHNTHMR